MGLALIKTWLIGLIEEETCEGTTIGMGLSETCEEVDA